MSKPASERTGSLKARLSSPVARLLNQMRETLVAPLRPFPLAEAGGSSARLELPYQSSPESSALRDHAASVTPMSVSALQHAHMLMSQMPAWLTMPETQRSHQGQVMLCWQGDQGRHFNIVVGADGMLIYSARLGNRGRFDGAEPIGQQLSPVILHAVERLYDSTALPRATA